MNIKDNLAKNRKKSKKKQKICTESIENEQQQQNIIIDDSIEYASSNKNINSCLENKIDNLLEIIKKTMLSVKKYKLMYIINVKDYNECIQALENIFTTLLDMVFPIKNKQKYDSEQYIIKLQEINAEISTIFRLYGTENVTDMLNVCFGTDYISKNIIDTLHKKKFDIMNKYIHPISYKVLKWKDSKPTSKNKNSILQKNRIIEDFMILSSADNLECFDLARTSKGFLPKVYGIKFCVHCPDEKKTLIISGITDDIIISCLNYDYIIGKLLNLKEHVPDANEYKDDMFERYINSLTLKELLVYDNDKLYEKFLGYRTQTLLMRQKPISEVTKNFIGAELYTQRTTLIQLLLMGNCHEYQYLAYLLYDLLSNDVDGNIDSSDQIILFDSLPLNIKKYFYDAMNQTKTYTNTLLNYDTAKIPLEQRICLLQVNDSVKEKAMIKLKEVKAKSEDSGIKARQYLDALLRIPFGIYREEPILKITRNIHAIFKSTVQKIQTSTHKITQFPIQLEYSNIEITKYTTLLTTTYYTQFATMLKYKLIACLTECKRNTLVDNITQINSIIKKHNIPHHKLLHSGKKREYMTQHIANFIDNIFSKMETIEVNINTDMLSSGENSTHINKKRVYLDTIICLTAKYNILIPNDNPIQQIIDLKNTILTSQLQMQKYIANVSSVLDDAVHGHPKVKRQIERIIGQWMTGEQTGYCFGFEGPPGVGKTSLAKQGIAKCLTDGEGNSRPFAFIAVGGSSNGSTIDGHNYTYVGSTWGKIVDILMDKQCMNPIIFIDELDKISKTENGREIIGILTHLIDSAQNDSFQDKYFSGVDLNLSKALFIFSYNDVTAIDSVLLDRIHRIKFEHLSIENKLVITNKYLLPEIYKNMGVEKSIRLPDEVIVHIIEKYTCEAGVRKLKQILFEIIGEINLHFLKNNNNNNHNNNNISHPIELTIDDIDKKYLPDRKEYKPKVVHTSNSVGLITGLWANSMGQGGILPIEVSLYPCASFLNLKLTGMQGDVMKESMTVAKTLAWSLMTSANMDKLHRKMTRTKHQGIHIHVPEGATPKDGPSAGVAITTAIYSLFTGKKIRSDIAITGEICLQGKITAIGGLNLKILGGIRAGVKEFVFPKENMDDYEEFIKNEHNKNLSKNIKFTPLETIREVFNIVFEQ
jgi:ATP-dependent Lon protease